MNDYLLEVRHLTKHYGKVAALEDVSFGVPRGSVYGLIGPNGAGKTTALRILAGVLEPDGGEIVIGGRTVDGDKRYWAGKIGFMPDFFGVYPDLTTYEYLDFFGRAYGIPYEERTKAIDDLLELAELGHKKHEFVQHLSRGMQQRLCLARALIHDPDILLLDEPASGLDPRARVEFRQLVKRLQVRGKTILISSHILMELAEICDQVAILEKGHLVAAGDIDSIGKRVTQVRRLEIKPLGDPSKLADAVSGEPKVLDVKVSDGVVQVEFSGSEKEAAALLKSLVRQGFDIISFGGAESDLEEVYLSLTKGETQ